MWDRGPTGVGTAGVAAIGDRTSAAKTARCETIVESAAWIAKAKSGRARTSLVFLGFFACAVAL